MLHSAGLELGDTATLHTLQSGIIVLLVQSSDQSPLCTSRMRVSPLVSLVLALPVSRAQFDFEKEVAGFFDFGKIPREFSGFSTSGPSPVLTPATASSVFTAFSTDKLPGDSQDQIQEVEVEVEEINEKVSQSQAVVTDSFLPEFGEIKENIQEALSSEGTNSSKENNVKRRSYGASQGGRGYGGGGYGHFGGGGGGGGGGYQESGHGGGGGYEDDHKGGLVQYGTSSGHKVPPKPPGPFGPAKPNYKCEKTKETLFVTKVDFTSDVKCFTVFSVKCEESYSTGKVYSSRCSMYYVQGV